MEQVENHNPSIPNEAETTQLAPATTATHDSVITDLLLDPPVLDKIGDDNLLADTLCVAGDDFVQSLVDVVNQSIPGLDCSTNETKDCNYPLQSQPDIPSDELNSESGNIKEKEVVREADENGDESDEEPAVKKRRRIVILANDDDDDDDDSDEVDEECQSPTDIPIVVDSAELNDEHETPKPKCKKASTIMLKEIQARVLLESAVMIPADTSCRKKKNRILDSDEDEDVSGANDMVINDVSDIGLGSNDEAAEDVNSVDVRCNEIRGGEDDNLVMIQEEVFISQQENNLDIGTEMETCKLEYIEPDESQNSSEDDNSMHSNAYESPVVDETQGLMAGLFETDPSDSSQGEEIFGHDPQSEKEFMTTSDVEDQRKTNDSDNDRSSSSHPTVTENFCCNESDVEEGEIRLNYLRHKLRLISSSDDDSWKMKPKPQSPTVIDEKDDCEIGEVKLVDLPSIKIIDVRTINEIVNSVDSSYNNNNLEDSNLNNDDHSNNANNNNKHSSKRSSKSRKNKTNRDPFDFSTTSSSDDFIPNEIYFGSPDLLARHQRRKARRKESRRNKHKHKSRTNSHDPSSSSAEDTDSMDGRYSKKYLSHHNRNKANTKNNKRKKRKNDRFYDRSRDIPSDVYFGDVQVPLHVLHSYGATSNSNSDSDISANRKNKNTNRAGQSQRGHVNNNNNNNRKSAAASSRTRRYSSSSSMSTVNSIISPSRDNMIETMKRYLKAAGIMRQIKLNRLWEGCKSNKERADKILEVLREKGLEGEPTMAKCKELKIRLQTKKELEELNPNVIIVTEGRARRSTTRAATEKSLQTNPLEFSTTSAENEPQPNPTAEPVTDSAAAVAAAVDVPTPVECSTALIKLNNIVDWDSD